MLIFIDEQTVIDPDEILYIGQCGQGEGVWCNVSFKRQGTGGAGLMIRKPLTELMDTIREQSRLEAGRFIHGDDWTPPDLGEHTD